MIFKKHWNFYLLGFLILVAACGGGGGGGSASSAAPKPEIKGLKVKQVSTYVSLGDTVQFKAIGILPNDQTQDVTSFSEWSIVNSTDTELSAKGMLKIKNDANKSAVAKISAKFINPADTTYDASYDADAKITIEDRRILEVAVSPSSASLAKGQSQEFQCTFLFSNQTDDNASCDWTLALTGGSLDSSSTSSVSKKTGEKVSLYTSQVNATDATPISGTLTVSVADKLGNSKNAMVNVEVSGAKIRELKMNFVDVDATPNNASIAKGRKSQIFVEAVRTDDTSMDVSGEVTFSLASSGIINLDSASGKIIGESVGTVSVTAKYATTTNTDDETEKTTSEDFTVTAAEPVSLSIKAGVGTLIAENQKQSLTAVYELTDKTNQNAAAGDVSWDVTSTNTNSVLSATSGNPIDFSSDTIGDYRVKAEANNLDATIDIKVEKTPDITKPTISFDIPKERIVAGTIAFDISDISIDASDDRKIDAYYLSTDPAVPDKDDPNWITPASFPVKTSYNITQRPVNDYEELTIYAWSRDGARNISDVSSDKITVIHSIDYNNSDGKNPLIDQEWYLKNTGQNAYSASGGTAGEDLNVEYVHNTLGYKGKGIRVIVIDGSLETTHEDLSPNVEPGTNINYNLDYLISNTAQDRLNIYNPSPELSNLPENEGSHGTSVAGIIGMDSSNGIGGAGIAPAVSLSGINLLGYIVDDSGRVTGSFGNYGWAYQAYALGMYNSQYFINNANIQFCTVTNLNNGNSVCLEVMNFYDDELNNGGLKKTPQAADIFNMSYGRNLLKPEPFATEYNEIFKYGTTALRGGKGAVYVKAAGNEFRFFSESIPNGNTYDCSIGEHFIRTDSTNDAIFFLNLSSKYKPCHNASTSRQNALPYIILTAAVNAQGNNSSYSSSGSSIWISGTGGERGTASPAMVTTDRTGCETGYDADRTTDFNTNSASFAGENPGCKYINTFNGTSSAAPSISGVVALMLEANPKLTWLDVKHILAKTARKPDLTGIARTDITMDVSGTEFTSYVSRSWEGNTAFNSGFNNNFGWGIADAKAAVEMALDPNYKSLGSVLTVVEESATLSSGNTSIPNLDVNGRSSSITNTAGGAAKIRFVAVDVNLKHELLSDVTIRLRNEAQGIESTLFWAGSGHWTDFDGTMRLLSNAFYDLDYNAGDTWSLTIYDTANTFLIDLNSSNPPKKIYDQPGEFREWTLTLYTSP